MPIKKLEEFLDSHNIRYVKMSHSPAYTAQEIAKSAHIPGRVLAKTIIVNIDGNLIMAVLPAPYKIDIKRIADITVANIAEIAKEQDFIERFPGCEVGAMPPFGNLYGMQVYVDESLAKDEEIIFNAGSHKELIKLLYKDYETLVRPRIARFADDA